MSVCRGLNTGSGNQVGNCDTRAQHEGSMTCTSWGDVGQAPGAQSVLISTSILSTDSQNRQGVSVYHSDVALVMEVNDQLSVVVVPWICHYETKGGTRPEQALQPVFVLRAAFGSDTISNIANRQLVTFCGQSFTPQGFIVSPVSGVDLMRPQDDLPSKELLDIFWHCLWLFEDTYLKVKASLSSLQINIGNRVEVVRGEYQGIFGQVTRGEEKAVAVYMESQGLEEEILVDSIQRVFWIGDQVMILCGAHRQYWLGSGCPTGLCEGTQCWERFWGV